MLKKLKKYKIIKYCIIFISSITSSILGFIMIILPFFLPLLLILGAVIGVVTCFASIVPGNSASSPDLENQNQISLISGFIPPSSDAKIIINSPSSYGWFDPVGTITGYRHTGLDIAVNSSNPSPALAVYDGEIVDVVTGCKNTFAGLNIGNLSTQCPAGSPNLMIGSGNRIILKTNYNEIPGKNLYVSYSHLSQVYVTKGQIVKQGDVIGVPGNTGNSAGIHFHISLIELNEKESIYNFKREDFRNPLNIFCGIPGSEIDPNCANLLKGGSNE